MGGPEEITRFTGEPSAIKLPLAGSWLITLPEPIVSLVFWLISPTLSLAPARAAVAASRVMPFKSGTGTICGPEEITRFTGEPSATELPLAGSWLRTLPEPIVLLAFWVIVPTLSFAPVIAAVAAV